MSLTKEKTYFEVKPSQIKGAGMGLYTKKEFKKGQRIVEYKGKMKKWIDVNDGTGRNKYLLYIDKNHVIDAEFSLDTFGRYANDAKGPGKNLFKNNAMYLIEGKKVFLMAKRKILAGEEIFVGYGKEYWENVDL